MNGRKLAAFALSGVMAVGLTACGGNGEPNESPAGGSGGEAYLVGICQLAPHDALDAATRGFKAALVEAFGEDGVKFDEQNAGGEYNNCATIVDGFVSENVDLMLANATYSLQAAQSATADIPILGTAITNYGIALGLDSTEDKVLGGNIWPRWTSRPPCSRSCSPTRRTWVCSTAPPSPTPCFRWRPSRAIWRRWATPVPSTPSPT